MLKCGWCGKRPASESWDVRPCALGGEVLSLQLCRPCDVELNRMMLQLARYHGRTKVIAEYRQRLPC